MWWNNSYIIKVISFLSSHTTSCLHQFFHMCMYERQTKPAPLTEIWQYVDGIESVSSGHHTVSSFPINVANSLYRLLFTALDVNSKNQENRTEMGSCWGKNNKIVATWRQWRWEWCSLRVRLGWQVSTSFCQQTFTKFISAILARDRDLYNTNGCPTWKLLVLVSFSKPESRIPGGVTEFTNQFRHSRDKHKHLQLLDNSRDGEACVKSEKLVLLKGFQIPFPCWLTQNKSTGF